jgi:hypothetical protein
VSTPNLGEIPNSDLRDAVHIPVVCAQAGQDLTPSQDVKMVDGYAVAAPTGEGVGIADPYRTRTISKYETFWLFMRKIDGQPRHMWNHPDFPDELAQARAEGLEEGACCYGGG